MRELDTKGSMPFAIVAVALLLASAALCGVVCSYDETTSRQETVENEITAIDEALADITDYVNRGLGEIVMRLSTATAEGVKSTDTVEQRANGFKDMAAEWISFQFPMRSGGAVAEVKSYSLELSSLPAQISSETYPDGYLRTYLCGKGSIDVHISSEKGSSDTSIDVSTDGSYTLPLTAERLEMFRNMSSDGGVSVSQMMTYQLTCLAQYRVMNGYGGTSQYGPMGTSAIITESDVINAYNRSIQAAERMAFHSGDMPGGAMDLADLLAEDGRLTLDLSAVYSQALLAVIDDIALRWMDYFYGFEILEALENRLHPWRTATDSLKAFIFGEESVYSAVPYIEGNMGASELERSRHPGSGTTALEYGGISVTVQNPTGDVLSSSWLKSFGKRYAANDDYVKEYVLDVLRNAAVRIYEDKSLGTVSVEVDPTDEEGFASALAGLYTKALSGMPDGIGPALSESLSSTDIYDPYCGAIADEIDSHASDFVLSESLRSSLTAAFAAAIPEGSEVTVQSMIESGALDRAVRGYEQKVRSDLDGFDALRNVPSEQSLPKKVLSEILAFGIPLTGIADKVPEMASRMCGEMVSCISMNPESGPIELPEQSGFAFDDGSGMETMEKVTATLSSTAIVSSITIDESRCVHTVGFREDVSAAYSTMFVIKMDDSLTVDLVGTGAFSEAMGGISSHITDTVQSSYTIEVAVSSGWALSGIDYKPSTTILEDVWKALLKVLEPIIEPLRKIMETVRSAMTAISEALIEALSYVADAMVRIYEVLMDPIGALKEWFETTVEDIFSQATLDILVSIGLGTQKIVFEFFGCVLEFSTKAITWSANTKTLLSATLSMPVAGLIVTAGITAKVRGEVKKENLLLTGFGKVEGDDWSLKVTLDPLMKATSHLIVVDGDVHGTDFSIIAPKLENYQEMGIKLSDVPGIGEMVSNIPVMGVNVGLDAGFTLRYADPQKTGLIINEFETNPPGTDKGAEYVELYNNSTGSIDLEGYTLLAASDRKTKSMELSGTINPGEHLLIYPKFTLVNSSGKYTKNGEAVILKDADGNELDKTPTKKDGSDDERSWQRSYDGSTEWVFEKGTPGTTNNKYPLSNVVSASDMKDVVWSAVEKSFDQVDTITDLETLQAFLQYLTRYTLEGLINKVSGQLIEASVFASLDIKDPSSSASAGIRIALRTDGELVKDVMKYIVGKIMEVVLNAKNPYRIDPVEMFAENIDLEVVLHSRIGFPEVLSKGADLPEADIGAVFRTNLSAITSLAGIDTGRPEVMFGIRVADCPKELIPSKMSPRKNMDHDLWLMMATVKFASS